VPWPDAVSYIRHSHCTGYGLWGKISVVRPSSSPETARGARDGQARRCHARCLGHPGEGDVRAQPGSRVQGSAPGYRPRRRQTQSLYRVVSDHLETLLAEPVAHGAPPYPRHIEHKFRRFLTCGIRAQRYSPSFVSWRSQSAEQTGSPAGRTLMKPGASWSIFNSRASTASFPCCAARLGLPSPTPSRQRHDHEAQD
jgi:hypothetical protein